MQRLAGEDLVLTRPTSLAERWDVVKALGDDSGVPRHRALAGALGLCWHAVRMRIGQKYRGDIGRFGGEVIDLLMTAEVKEPDRLPTMTEIEDAGGQALKLCWDGLVTKQAVESAAGNSEAPTGSSFESSF